MVVIEVLRCWKCKSVGLAPLSYATRACFSAPSLGTFGSSSGGGGWMIFPRARFLAVCEILRRRPTEIFVSRRCRERRLKIASTTLLQPFLDLSRRATSLIEPQTRLDKDSHRRSLVRRWRAMHSSSVCLFVSAAQVQAAGFRAAAREEHGVAIRRFEQEQHPTHLASMQAQALARSSTLGKPKQKLDRSDAI